MRRRMMVIQLMALLGLVLVLAISTVNGEWKMQVHTYTGIDEYAVSDVDSVTFYDDMVVPPGMVMVPAGVFWMGDGNMESQCGIDEREVTLTHDFYLGQHEVTNQEYMEALQWAYDNGYVTVNLSHEVRDDLDGSTVELLGMGWDWSEIQFDGEGTFYLRESPSTEAQNAYPNGYDPGDHPVLMVTWYGAARYCDWLSLQAGLPRAYEHTGDWSCNGGDPYGAQGYRLPTDAEWEYATQIEGDRAYPWGDDDPDCSIANYRWGAYEMCIGWTTPVETYPVAPSSLGLYDMGGNLMEWCNDWHVCDLGDNPDTDPIGPASALYKVLHGGSWYYNQNRMRCSIRFDYTPTSKTYEVGFRPAKSVNP
ncbi:MAG: formylglycine-generating enzyme family protein [Candidatus Eisenbacteria bacterium]|uniref:Formylglycine-generating enzyme family protein n=1 Tax=Eiseniibacteriota bacterium TaxID=2212470 RepID=A0A948RTS6_UNCEI|nr:formylglycine-generating enzyme family protein [Candidatus Eisenbacteria bacterium]MBU2689312.1 formylglycine-generating enzyme family protein [Candidatus Eisenbacteria bacterium]